MVTTIPCKTSIRNLEKHLEALNSVCFWALLNRLGYSCSDQFSVFYLL
ncbi:MAG: hypothetical protein AAF443_01630 [Chlamydiota bacterium]